MAKYNTDLYTWPMYDVGARALTASVSDTATAAVALTESDAVLRAEALSAVEAFVQAVGKALADTETPAVTVVFAAAVLEADAVTASSAVLNAVDKAPLAETATVTEALVRAVNAVRADTVRFAELKTLAASVVKSETVSLASALLGAFSQGALVDFLSQADVVVMSHGKKIRTTVPLGDWLELKRGNTSWGR